MMQFYATNKGLKGVCRFIGLIIGLLIGGELLYAADNSAKSQRLQSLESKLNTTQQQIQTIIGDASCENPSQCRVLPIGSRPCGGPAKYIAYSILNTDVKRLKVLAQQHRVTQRQINRIKKLVSTCEMVLQPPVACVNKHCSILEK